MQGRRDVRSLWRIIALLAGRTVPEGGGLPADDYQESAKLKAPSLMKLNMEFIDVLGALLAECGIVIKI